MRKYTLLLIALFVALLSTASPIDKAAALKVAQAQLGTLAVSSAQLRPSTVRRLSAITKTAPAYYIFNADNGQGFVIVSGDDALPSILGYSTSASIPANATLPDALVSFLNQYAAYVSDVRSGKATAPSRPTTTDNTTVGPLCQSNWGQDAPYNNLCPSVNDTICPSGCVATAMAQIMYYYKWPTAGVGYGTATCNGKSISGSLANTYNWDAMLDNTDDYTNNATASAAVAQLVYDCGLANSMSYATSGSGSYTPTTALYSHFNYNPTTLRYYFADCFASTSEFLQVIKNEINAGRPVYMDAASATTGGRDALGHAFVLDGYQGNLVHVNWGWDGYANGNFDITVMAAGGYQFTQSQGILTGITPNTDGATGTPQAYPYMQEAPTTTLTSFTKGSTATATMPTCYNVSQDTHYWRFTFALYDPEGNVVAQDLKTTRMYTYSGSIESYRGLSSGDYSFRIPTSVANGDYAIRVVFQERTSETPATYTSWMLPDVVGGSAKNALYVKVNGSTVTVTNGADFVAAGISSVKAAAASASDAVYNLQGVRMPEGKLPAGVYIRNGKKFVEK
jgi:hypothetical protein